MTVLSFHAVRCNLFWKACGTPLLLPTDRAACTVKACKGHVPSTTYLGPSWSFTDNYDSPEPHGPCDTPRDIPHA